MINFKKKISKATWTEHAADTEKMRNPSEMLVDERKRKKRVGRCRCRLEDNIKTDHWEIEFEVMD